MCDNWGWLIMTIHTHGIRLFLQIIWTLISSTLGYLWPYGLGPYWCLCMFYPVYKNMNFVQNLPYAQVSSIDTSNPKSEITNLPQRVLQSLQHRRLTTLDPRWRLYQKGYLFLKIVFPGTCRFQLSALQSACRDKTCLRRLIAYSLLANIHFLSDMSNEYH